MENTAYSKLKKRLLNIFFAFPKRSFHINELKAMISSSSRRILPPLRELAQSDAVRVHPKKKKSYFRINPYFPFYNELKAMVQDKKTAGEDAVSRKLRRVSSAKLIILTGVFTGEPHLPIDLLFVGEKVSRARLQRILEEVESLCDQEINYSVMNHKEYDHRRAMSDRLVRDILDNTHVVVYNR